MNERVHAFPKGISPKVNVIAWLEFELTHYKTVVQYVDHYTADTPRCSNIYGNVSMIINYDKNASSKLIIYKNLLINTSL